MRRRLIKDFENDYCLLENGEILDLQTNKIKRTYKRGRQTIPYVDLYKDGELVLGDISVIKLILLQYFDVVTIDHYTITYLDGNDNNLSLNNLEVTNKENPYNPKLSLYKKPNKIYRFTIDEAIVINQKERDQISYLNMISTKTYIKNQSGVRKKSKI